MNLQLQKPDLERYITEQVRSGNFATPEAVVEDALLHHMEHGELSDEDIAAINLSDAQIDRGEGVSSEEVAAQMQRLFDSA